MQQVCYCGRRGRIEDYEPVLRTGKVEALRCPKCGHIEFLLWVSDDNRRLIFAEAERRRAEPKRDGPTGDRRWYEAEVLMEDLSSHRHAIRGTSREEIEAEMRNRYEEAVVVLVHAEKEARQGDPMRDFEAQ